LPALSEWLQLMLAEIARKREELEHARAEQAQRVLEGAAESPEAAAARQAESAPPQDESARAAEGSAARAVQR
jgi:hypothetical protein